MEARLPNAISYITQQRVVSSSVKKYFRVFNALFAVPFIVVDIK
jgi:hypothetical protein